MNLQTISFYRLDSARKRLGHTVERACAEIGIHEQTWYDWQRGPWDPKLGSLRKIEAYIRQSRGGER